jgi:transcriptional regulator with XRE-family HTH domain
MNDGIDARLRMARAWSKRTQKEVADEAGVGLATLQRAENGEFEPRQSTLRKLAAALNVRLEWLVTGDGPMWAERDEDQ